MFTWTSEMLPFRRAFLILAMGFLVACEGGPDVGMGAIGFARAPDRVVVASKSIVIAGPRGYCVDRSATRDDASGVFVLLGSCASIANNARAAAPRIPGVLTASVSDQSSADISASLDELEAFFTSTEGRAALARDGQAGSITILATRRRVGAFYLHVRDDSENRVVSLAPIYWRGLFDVRGRIVTVTVTGFKDSPMSAAVGLATLNAFAARIRRENAAASVDLDRGTDVDGLNDNLG